MRVLNHAFGHPMKLEEQAAMPLAGGLIHYGHQCGIIWGAALAAGAQAYRLHGPGPQAEAMAVTTAQHLMDSFRDQNNNTNCLELTGLDSSSSPLQMSTYFLIKGGVKSCTKMAVRYAQEAFREISTTLCEEPAETPCSPVGCAAILAKKMGASDLHKVMAAGLAGGIGLCGGACGALGAALWLNELNSLKKGAGHFNLRKPRGLDIIDRFLKCTDSEFRCSKIVGRRFKNVDDHAAFLRDGGCSKIIDVLAAE